MREIRKGDEKRVLKGYERANNTKRGSVEKKKNGGK